MKREELIKKLKEAAKKMENDNAEYEVREELTVGRGEGNYKFFFRAKKKGGFGALGLISSAARIARGAMWGGVSGAIWTATNEAARRTFRHTLDPINEKMKGKEIAAILYRWAETIPQGFLETIGSDIVLPDDDKYISATIKPKNEIKLVIDFVKLRSDVEAATEEVRSVEEEIEKIEEHKVPTPTPIVPQTVPIPVIPEAAKQYFLSSINALYVEGTLKNTESGFSLDLENKFTDVGLVSPLKLVVDGVEIESEKITIRVGEQVIKNNEINLSNPLVLKLGSKASIHVEGVTLPAGPHRVDIEASIQGIGKVNLTIMDNI